jgi:hypothetical protein
VLENPNKTDRHDKTEMLLKVALNTIKPTKPSIINSIMVPELCSLINDIEKKVFNFLHVIGND